MEIKREYLQKYIHNIAIEQLVDEYRHKGYQVSTDEKIGKYPADLIAGKDSETIVFEVKSGKLTPQKGDAIAEIADLVKKMNNYKFFVVMATPPQKKKLEVSNIGELLTRYMEENMPDNLHKLSEHTTIDKVALVTIDEITVRENGSIFVNGNGVVHVTLHYGADGDQNVHNETETASFPFDFELTLVKGDDKNLRISEVFKLDIDTSDY